MDWYSLVLYLGAVLAVYILCHLAVRHLRAKQQYRDALLRVLYLYGIHRVYWAKTDAADDLIEASINQMEEEVYGE